MLVSNAKAALRTVAIGSVTCPRVAFRPLKSECSHAFEGIVMDATGVQDIEVWEGHGVVMYCLLKDSLKRCWSVVGLQDE